MQCDVTSSVDSQNVRSQRADQSASGRLFGDLIFLPVGFHFQPLSIEEERGNANANNEDDAEHEDDTGVLAGPILSFDKEMKAMSLGSAETDGSHRVVCMPCVCVKCERLWNFCNLYQSELS